MVVLITDDDDGDGDDDGGDTTLIYYNHVVMHMIFANVHYRHLTLFSMKYTLDKLPRPPACLTNSRTPWVTLVLILCFHIPKPVTLYQTSTCTASLSSQYIHKSAMISFVMFYFFRTKFSIHIFTQLTIACRNMHRALPTIYWAI